MPKPPPVHELEFLRISANHYQFAKKLTSLGVGSANIGEFARHVCASWFQLGELHLAEAQKLVKAGIPRATLSRAYYAAYNASKATRYLSQGSVSLKGDDHGKASTDLPMDFPNVAHWAQRVTVLYENRLRADYDNWQTTPTDFTLTPDAAVDIAQEFIDEVRHYLNTKYGMTL